MKRISRITLVAAGFALLAVIFSLVPTQQAQADNDRDRSDSPALTHLGVRPSNFVVLDCTAFSIAGLCTQYALVARDGTATVYSGPPKGFQFVLTDLSWQSFGNPSGQIEGATLFNSAGTLRLFANNQPASYNGDASGNIHFTAGLIYTAVPYIIVNNGNPQLQLIGYNVPN